VVWVEILRTWPTIVTLVRVSILDSYLVEKIRTWEMGEPSILNSELSAVSASMTCLIVTGRKLSFLKFYSHVRMRADTGITTLTDPPLGLVCDPPLKKPPPPAAPPPALYEVVLP